MSASDESAMRNPWLTLILPRLYVGNRAAAMSLPLLEERGIKRVVAIAQGDLRREKQLWLLNLGAGSAVRQLPLLDGAFEKDPEVERAMHFIDESREAGQPVLVFCRTGASLAPALAVTYLAWKGLPVADALRLVRAHEPAIPNLATLKSFLSCIGAELPQRYAEWFHAQQRHCTAFTGNPRP